jgi:alcohol dehydrogenase class IV
MAATQSHDFRAVTYPCRIYSGKAALDQLPGEVARHRGSRAFVICGQSVARDTRLIVQIAERLGASFAGCFDGMRKETPLPDVIEARDQARAAGADVLIAVGAGSVIQGVRVVAILLAEMGPIEQLATQYPSDGGPAFSPKLMAPKLPIINVLTVGTSAQNRGGSPAKAPGVEPRLEFFDPKTRPVALFWDEDALLTAPAAMVRASFGAIFWRAAMSMGYEQAPVLVDLTRRQAFDLTWKAIDKLGGPDDSKVRMDLCVATFLQNREIDEGGGLFLHWVSRVVYALAASMFSIHEQISQGDAQCALTPTMMRHFGDRNPGAMCNIAECLGVWREGDSIADAPLRAADKLEEIFKSLGLPTRVGQLGIPVSTADEIVAGSLRNFNADPKREFQRNVEPIRQSLLAAW